MESGFHLYQLHNLLLCCFDDRRSETNSSKSNSKFAGAKSKNKDKKGEKEAPVVDDVITADETEQVSAEKKEEDKTSSAGMDAQGRPEKKRKNYVVLTAICTS